MSRAIYAGSFDPVTNGHVDVIVRGARLFDELVIAIGNNPAKRYLFDPEERAQLLADAIEGTPAELTTFSGLLVDTARRCGATVILRGVRALSDFDLEFRNGLANRDLAGIETLFLLSDPQHIFVSSSLVKEIASCGGDISSYVPPVVAEALRRRLS
ncbi:MAG TPA: pantetheine-phosphate adenylyltransferase [Deltaproteobacteria bacterium]|nr:pantetheine-phosphate adenylyltransferase [Deltaproteobacteria bacterium]